MLLKTLEIQKLLRLFGLRAKLKVVVAQLQAKTNFLAILIRKAIEHHTRSTIQPIDDLIQNNLHMRFYEAKQFQQLT